jgi:hypothetical protein
MASDRSAFVKEKSLRQAQPEVSSGTKPISAPARVKAAERYYRYAGAIHIHTTYSDGSGSFQEVADEASEAGLDYFIATDHNTLQPLKEGHQRYWGSTLALIGTEVSTDQGHFLALDLPADFAWEGYDARRLIRQVNDAGGFGIIAHPLSAKSGWRIGASAVSPGWRS